MRDGFVKVAAGSPAIRVADCGFNAGQIRHLLAEADKLGVKVLCLPELCVTGAACGDLFLTDTLLDGALAALDDILRMSHRLDTLVVVGIPLRGDWGGVYNCAAVLHRGRVLGVVPKRHLSPQERRWFVSEGGGSVTLRGERFDLRTGCLFFCENLPRLSVGVEVGSDRDALQPPALSLASQGAVLILNPAAQPARTGEANCRRNMILGQSRRLMCGYLSAGAGEGESTANRVCDGHCLAVENGELLAERRFEAGLAVSEIDVDALAFVRRREPFSPLSPGTMACPAVWVAFPLTMTDTPLSRRISPAPFVPDDPMEREELCRDALEITARGLAKRLEHSRAKAAVVGLSGGLDSTLAALITARALDMLGRPRTQLAAVTMPCFGTTSRTRDNAQRLAEGLGASLRVVDISAAVKQHFSDIGQGMDNHDATYENAQARERTQVLMDIANQLGGIVVGTGDLSELALGWCTYNGDHMSMYGVNGGIPKTLMRHLTAYAVEDAGGTLGEVLRDILDTPVSPELLPPKEGEIAQKTEELVGPYELHDFFLYHAVRWGCPPRKLLRLAEYPFGGRYDRDTIRHWLRRFWERFFSQQFKRACLPDGPAVGPVSLSAAEWQMPSDAVAELWLEALSDDG